MDVNGASLYFEEIGNMNKPVLVLLHGGFQNIEPLNSITQYLADHFRIIGVDSRGHGKSTLGSAPLSYQQLHNDLEYLLNNLGINSINLAGFSDGGIVSYRIAAESSIQVERLIAIGASWRDMDIAETEGMIKTITPESAKEIFPDEYNDYLLFNPEPDFDKLTRSITNMWLDKTETGHPNDLVETITAKTLLMRGDKDFLVSVDSLADLQKRIQHSSLMNVPFAEHEVHKTQPQLTKYAIKQFMGL